MADKSLTIDCLSCESNYTIYYETEITSAELPEFCPFCGEVIDKSNIKDDYIEDEDDDLDNEEDVYEWTPEEE